ncbi:MAG: corrinoid protein [Vicinamibacterales bacterium]|jgi:corrinoid protein of di/trimethylamine methyltransferase|nr:corrinoid protein [Vicinamibacterales bacterium]
MSILSDIAASLQRGEDDEVASLVRQALDDGQDAVAILHGGLIAGMGVVGEQFREREIFLPDVLLAARAMYAGLALLKPLLAKDGVPTAGTVVIGSVRGDLHDIGKNLVGIMLAGAGFDVVDLGSDVAPERFVDAACDHGASVIGLSALLTTTMPVMKDVVELVRARGLQDRIKIIVGGAAVSDAWARQIGADAYGYDAASAVERVRALARTPA